MTAAIPLIQEALELSEHKRPSTHIWGRAECSVLWQLFLRYIPIYTPVVLWKHLKLWIDNNGDSTAVIALRRHRHTCLVHIALSTKPLVLVELPLRGKVCILNACRLLHESRKWSYIKRVGTNHALEEIILEINDIQYRALQHPSLVTQAFFSLWYSRYQLLESLKSDQ